LKCLTHGSHLYYSGDSAQRIYNYNIFTNNYTNHIAIRTKYNITWNSGWELSKTDTLVNFTGVDITTTNAEERFLWKDSVNDNVLYALAITEDVEDTLKFEYFEINFTTGTYTENDSNTYYTTGKPISYFKQYGYYIYGVIWDYDDLSPSNEINLEFIRFNMENGTLVSGNIGTFETEYDYFYNSLADFFVDRASQEICILAFLQHGNLGESKTKYSFGYGTLSGGVSLKDVGEWDFVSGYSDFFHVRWIGDSKASSALFANFIVKGITTPGVPNTYTAIYASCYTTNGTSLTTYEDSLVSTDTTKINGFLLQPRKDSN